MFVKHLALLARSSRETDLVANLMAGIQFPANDKGDRPGLPGVTIDSVDSAVYILYDV